MTRWAEPPWLCHIRHHIVVSIEFALAWRSGQFRLLSRSSLCPVFEIRIHNGRSLGSRHEGPGQYRGCNTELQRESGAHSHQHKGCWSAHTPLTARLESSPAQA